MTTEIIFHGVEENVADGYYTRICIETIIDGFRICDDFSGETGRHKRIRIRLLNGKHVYVSKLGEKI